MSKNIIAITGGIGSGKSTVSEIIKELGYTVFDCDEIAREITKEDDFLKKVAKIDERFVKTADGKKVYDRKTVSSIAFGDSEKLKKLNELIHPRVFEKLEELKSNAKSEPCFCEIQLLFETQSEDKFDGVIIVTSRLEKRIERIEKRNGLTKEQIANVMNTQIDYSTLETGERIVIENDCDVSQLKARVEKAIELAKEKLS